MAAPDLRLALIVLRCGDIEVSRAFYEALGIRFDSVEDGGPERFCGRVGDATLELCPKGSANTTDVRLGFRVEQLANVLPALRESGGKVIRTLGSPRLLYAVVKDPDGHNVELRAAPH